MAQINIPLDLPKGVIIETLAKKVDQRGVPFDYFGVLEMFRKRVSDEVRHINELFPEYTPHDEYYHLRRLFSVAEVVLSNDVIEAMNATELFLLALSLYGHDWGMAVSVAERECISGLRDEKFALLNNEREDFQSFLNLEGFTLENLPHYLWQEYVRRTHALRSGQRVISYFEPIDNGIGEAAARICEGHWLDLKELNDHDKYPTNFSVLGELVNLRALAVYLRLIDLLDIGNDRTPYVIWKFVSPKNEFSKLEWEKHRALQPVTSAPYQEGRILIIEGNTDSSRVYAALTDLKNYCNHQIKGCTNLIAQINDPFHKINIYHAEWRIRARGFKPISIQFEFERQSMFNVLSDEIYKGDYYVFLRELLQNSIDAITMRRQLLLKKDVIANNIGKIEILVNRDRDDEISIDFKDDGIGMDEYVIKNYLSVAGKSYYSSNDFHKLGIKMDPISKFGVGILSCFMVADEIEIDTYKDPYLSEKNERLKIIIPAVDKQFRFEVLNSSNAKVGTTVRIKVKKSKLKAKSAGSDLDVIEYLSYIAGFVEYPITIVDSSKKAVILTPYSTEQTKAAYSEKGFLVQTMKITFPFEDAFQPHSWNHAYQFFSQKCLDLKEAFKIEGIEGSLCFLEIADNNLSSKRNYGETVSLIENQTGRLKIELFIKEGWKRSYFLSPLKKGFQKPRMSLFIDGILVEDGFKTLAESFKFILSDRQLNHNSIAPYLVLNVKKKFIKKIDLSRTNFIENEASLSDLISNSLGAYFGALFKEVDKSNIQDYVLKLSKLATNLGLTSTVFCNNIDRAQLPVGFIGNNELYYFQLSSQLKDTTFKGLPIHIKEFANSELESIFYYGTKSRPMNIWKGGPVIIDQHIDGNSRLNEIENISSILTATVNTLFEPTGIDFVTPPFNSCPFLPRLTDRLRKLDSEKTTKTREDFIKKLCEARQVLTEVEILSIDKILGNKVKGRLPLFATFPKPFEQYLAMSIDILNYRHPFSIFLVTSIARFVTKYPDKTFDENVSLLYHLISNLPFGGYSNEIDFDLLNKQLNKMTSIMYKLDILNEVINWEVSSSDFVPNSIFKQGQFFRPFTSYSFSGNALNLDFGVQVSNSD
ncbi:MAG: hypothetical protein EOO46_12215 [Flavobacterium sp.]|nr:MAG: hypothetical protein EOO46_12215 [Flavobacterium sp.]